jgi:hypothetical protein
MTTAFEPAKYLTSLITAVNDGAKSAQTGAIAFTLVGLYLLATAFSTTDEDLLLQHSIPVSQIGVQVPVVFSFGIAPAVFLFLHVYTLIRYDMLAVNLRQFRTELSLVSMQSDQERYQQLLTNVEFVQVRAAPHNSRLYYMVEWLVLAGFPVATLLIVQVSSLRYQSDMIVWTQRICITLDLVLLFWFYPRQGWRPPRNPSSRMPYWVPWILLALVLFGDLRYLNAPKAEDQTVRGGDDGPIWSKFLRQPIDLVLCPGLSWGCRYLSVGHRTLVARSWRPEAIVELRSLGDEVDDKQSRSQIKKSLAAIEGVYLRNRVLRFAKFDESQLYAADLGNSDLRGATFWKAQLQGVNLDGALLHGGYLYRANLRAASIEGASLQSANLGESDLRWASLESTSLIGADLTDANLRNTSLVDASFEMANLSNSDLRGAYLGPPHPSAPPEVRSARVTQSQIDTACGDSETRLPPPLKVHICPPSPPFPR